MVSARLLTKARSRNDANASGLKEMRGVEHISRLTSLLRCSESLLRELDLRECVHGSLHGVARNSLNNLEHIYTTTDKMIRYSREYY